MYGDSGNKLVRELKRYEDSLPPYNEYLVQEINTENNYLFKEAQKLFQNENNNDASKIAYSKLCGAVIHRNKR